MAEVELMTESASVRLQATPGIWPMDGEGRARYGLGRVGQLGFTFAPEPPLRGHIPRAILHPPLDLLFPVEALVCDLLFEEPQDPGVLVEAREVQAYAQAGNGSDDVLIEVAEEFDAEDFAERALHDDKGLTVRLRRERDLRIPDNARRLFPDAHGRSRRIAWNPSCRSHASNRPVMSAIAPCAFLTVSFKFLLLFLFCR